MSSLVDRFQGSIAALAIADASGAPFEGGPLERLVWSFIGRSGRRRRWTDDTQMTLDLCESLVTQGKLDCQDAAQRFARSYRWSRGYGPGTAKVLKHIRGGVSWEEANRRGFREGSFGNGGAMRVAPVALFYGLAGPQSAAMMRDYAHRSASITHAHPVGQDAAACVATAVLAALHDATPAAILNMSLLVSTRPELRSRLQTAKTLLSAELLTAAEVAEKIGNGVDAAESCTAAILIGARYVARPFSALLGVCREVGGDVDTIGAMAGAIWGAGNGLSALPLELLSQVEDSERILSAGLSLFEAASRRQGATV